MPCILAMESFVSDLKLLNKNSLARGLIETLSKVLRKVLPSGILCGYALT